METDSQAPDEGPDPAPDYDRDARGRFAEGNRGGPGRPKGRGTPSLKAALLRAIEESEQPDGRDLTDALVRRAIKAASEGDFRFFKEIFDRLDGPVKQEASIDTTVVVERVSRRPNKDDDDVIQP